MNEFAWNFDGLDYPAPATSKSHAAFEMLREKITSLELAPGQPLHEAALMESLGIGRTPLREAIQRLIASGLVVAHPRQAPVVAPIQAFEVPQIVEMRLILEVSAVRLAVERATPQDIARIQAAHDLYVQAVRDGDHFAVVEADSAIHESIVAAAHNPHLAQAIAWNRNFGRRLWFLSVRLGGPLSSSEVAHEPIIKAIVERDADKAEQLIRAHIQAMQSRLQALLSGGSLAAVKPRSRAAQPA